MVGFAACQHVPNEVTTIVSSVLSHRSVRPRGAVPGIARPPLPTAGAAGRDLDNYRRHACGLTMDRVAYYRP